MARNAREASNARWVNIRWKPRVMPSAVITYRPTIRLSSSGPMAWFQSTMIATTTHSGGTATPIRFPTLWIRLT